MLLVVAATVTCVTNAVARRKPLQPDGENLLTVITPVPKSVAIAHPWVNVRIRFGQASDGSAADLSTFNARFGRCRLPTRLFDDVEEDGVVVEKRLRLTSETAERCRLRNVRQPRNRLKFKVYAVDANGKRRRLRDIDKVGFGVSQADNEPPEASLRIDTDVLTPDVEVIFSARESYDPNGDWLTYQWDFGDGATATGEIVGHTYTSDEPAIVQLLASDAGGLTGVARRTLPALPALDDGRTQGILRLLGSSEATLDFGAVPVGQTDTRTFTVRNDATHVATSQVKMTIEAIGGGGAFKVDCPPMVEVCDLGPGDERQVTVTFAPTEANEHAEAVLELLATASNRGRIQLLAHGYGEEAGGRGRVPWKTSGTAFYSDLSDRVLATTPEGEVMTLDVGTGTCQGGSFEGAPCVVNKDCPEGVCGDRLCVGGSNPGSPCGEASSCPLGTCGEPFEAISLCADGTGSVYLLNDDVRFDPDPDRYPSQTGMILRVGLDGNRSVVTDQVTEDSLVLACDRRPGGRVFWAQYDLFGPDLDERENLKSVPKSGGQPTTHVVSINKRLGDVDPENYIDPIDGFVDYEPTAALRVTADGTARYVGNSFGLYRLDPEPLVLTLEVDGLFAVLSDEDELFDIFPDGSLLVAHINEDNTESMIRLYKIDPNNALNGALKLKDLSPWATTTVPNNRGPCKDPCPRTTLINGMAVDDDGRVFVNLSTTGGADVIPSVLRPQGTVRFEPGPEGASGIPAGFVNLGSLRRLSF